MDWIIGIIQSLSCLFTAWILLVLHTRLTTPLKGILYFAFAFLAWAAAGGYSITLPENPDDHSFMAVVILTLCSMVNNYYLILGAYAVNDGEVTSRFLVRRLHAILPSKRWIVGIFIVLYGVCLMLVYRHSAEGYLLETLLSIAVVVVVTFVLGYTMAARKLESLWFLTGLAGLILIISQWMFYAQEINSAHHDTWLLASLFSKTSWSCLVIVIAVTWVAKENTLIAPKDLGLEMTVEKDRSKTPKLVLRVTAISLLNQERQLIDVSLRKKKAYQALLRLCLYKKLGVDNGYVLVKKGTDLDNYNTVSRDIKEMMNTGLSKGEEVRIDDFFEIRKGFGVTLRVPPESITLDRSAFKLLPRKHHRPILQMFDEVENLAKDS